MNSEEKGRSLLEKEEGSLRFASQHLARSISSLGTLCFDLSSNLSDLSYVKQIPGTDNVVFVYKSKRLSKCACTPCPPYAMDIILDALREVKVDDVLDVSDVFLNLHYQVLWKQRQLQRGYFLLSF
jgi:hypothetical protein